MEPDRPTGVGSRKNYDHFQLIEENVSGCR